MNRKIPIRAAALALGAGALVGGLVIALLGYLSKPLGSWTSGLISAGIAIAAIGLVAAVIGAIGFAVYGSAKPPRSGG